MDRERGLIARVDVRGPVRVSQVTILAAYVE